MLGKPLMPWQQAAIDVAYEIDPETGEFAYDEVGITVMRQQGKSTLLLSKNVHRCTATGFFGGRQHLVYTAQTRQKAREKWEEEYAPELEAAKAFKGRYKASWANGNEHFRFQNGSRWGIEATTEKAGHGSVLDGGDIDEAFSHQDTRTESAIVPAMITRRNAQLWWVSTAGWSDGSPYLSEKVRVGRASVLAGVRKGLCYIEYSADEDADPGDPATWWSCMPALGHTITEAKVRAAYDKAVREDSLGEFKRANLNIWVPKPAVGTESAIPSWPSLALPGATVEGRILGWSVDVSPDREHATISAVGKTVGGRRLAFVVEVGSGVDWIIPSLLELQRTKGLAEVAIDGATDSPPASLIPHIRRAGIKVREVTASDMAKACSDLMDAVTLGLKAKPGGLAHLNDQILSDALKVARTRDGGRWVRKGSGNITPIVSLTLANWTAQFAKAPPMAAFV